MQHKFSWRAPKSKKRCLVIRYGGYGDLLQAASIFPGLKAQGWHLTVNCTPIGQAVCKHDPHVDAWLIQDKNQVPVQNLEEYWKGLGREYDRVLNLCESIEGSLLAIPGRRNHALPHGARHRMMDINYLEWLHLLADVPFEPAAKFYGTKGETIKARKLVEKVKKPLVVWALAGSSIHKAWPWFDNAVQMLIENGVAVAMVGGPECQILEKAIMQTVLLRSFGIPYETSEEMSEGEMLAKVRGRYGHVLIPTCGKIDIRLSLTLATIAHTVVGPETGVLNAVGLDPAVRKVIMLSHSSVENLTKHWKNTTAISPKNISCFPCHRLHYTSEFCYIDEATGAAKCSASIPASVVVSHVMRTINGKTSDQFDRQNIRQLDSIVA